MKKIFLLILLIISFCAYSESVYQLDYKTDAIIGSASLGLFIPSLLLEADATTLSSNPQVNSLDELWTRSYNVELDDISTYSAYAALLLPGISLVEQRKDFSAFYTYGVMYAEAFLLTTGTKDMLKYIVPRNRPYTTYDGIPKGEEKDYYNSFPSGHTAYAFMGATFLSTTFSQEYPESQWKVPVIAGSYTLASAIAAMRIESGNHYITDVLAGAAIGSLYGWLVPQMHLRSRIQNSADIRITPYPKGIWVSIQY